MHPRNMTDSELIKETKYNDEYVDELKNRFIGKDQWDKGFQEGYKCGIENGFKKGEVNGYFLDDSNSLLHYLNREFDL